MVYALKDKKYFQFSCISKTEKELEEKIESSYRSWRGSCSRDSAEETKSKEVFLESFIKVKLTVNRL